jgi:hypothetical protein
LLNWADLLIQSNRLETQLHELRGMRDEWKEEKARVSVIKETMSRGMQTIVDSAVERDEYIDKALDKFQERLNRHRVEIDKSYRREKELKERVEVLEAQIESMSEKLCHCGKASPVFDDDGGLEYAASDEYHTPPISSLVVASPEENEEPIPIALMDRAEDVPDNLDQENRLLPCCLTPLVRRDAILVPIEEVEERDPRITTVGQRASRRRDRRVDPYRMTAGNQQERFHRYLQVFDDVFVSDREFQRRRRDFRFLVGRVESSADVGGDRSCTSDRDSHHHSSSRQRSFLIGPCPAAGQSRQCGRLDWPISGGLWSGASDAA